MSRQLVRRLCQSIPLSTLRQGGTLSIESSLVQPVRVNIVPQWREDGHASFQQMLTPDQQDKAEMVVSQEEDLATSLGRIESHVSILVRPKKQQNNDESSTTAQEVTTEDGTILFDSKKWTDPSSPITLTAKVPEKVNLSCNLPLGGGSISIDNKIEGDVHLVTADGDVRATKLRGHDVDITTESQGNVIYASNVIEAQRVNLSTKGRVRAKQIHGTNIDIYATSLGTAGEHEPDETKNGNDDLNDDDVVASKFKMDVDDEGSAIDVGSLYVSRGGCANLWVTPAVAATATTPSTTEQRNRAVRVKSNHGHVSVQTALNKNTVASFCDSNNNDPVVELGGVNGSCDVSISVENDGASAEDAGNVLAGQFHFDSASPNSCSVITANQGDVAITLDRKLEADLRLVSSPNISALDARTTLLEDDNPKEVVLNALRRVDGGDSVESNRAKDPKIVIRTDAFTKRPESFCDGSVEYVDGWVENKSMEPDSRFDVKNREGKIRLEGAASQALHGFTTSHDDDGTSGEDRPLLAVATSGKIVVETLSWLGAIARRYGFDEKEQK